MATIFDDVFTGIAGVALQSHTPGTGTGWAKNAMSAADYTLSGSGTAYTTTGVLVAYEATCTYPTGAGKYRATLTLKNVGATTLDLGINDYWSIGVRLNDSDGSGYWFFANGGFANIYRSNAAGSPTLVGGDNGVIPTIAAGGTLSVGLECETVGSNVLLHTYINGAADATATDTAPGSPYTSPGKAGVVVTLWGTQSSTTGAHLSRFNVDDTLPAGPALSVSPTTASATDGGPAVSMTPTLTGSVATLAASVSGGGTLSTTTPASGVAFTWTPPLTGTGSAVVTVADATDSLTATCTISYAPAAAQWYDDPHLIWSPETWAMTSGGTPYAQSAQPGAYLKMGFTGASLAAGLDVSVLGAGGVPVRWRIDGGPWQSFAIYPATSSPLSLASGLAAGNHDLYLEISAVAFADRFSTANLPTALRLTGFTLAGGAATIAPPITTVYPRKMIGFGDSTMESVGTADPWYSWFRLVAEGLGCEHGNMGIASLALTHDNGAGYPPTYDYGVAVANTYNPLSSWDKYYAGRSRLVGGRFASDPEYVLVNHGRNDFYYQALGVGVPTTPVITLAMVKFLQALRAAAPHAWIFWVVPFTGEYAEARTSVLSAVNTYRAANPNDAKVDAIDCHPEIAAGLGTAYASGSFTSNDGVHWNQDGNARGSALILAKIKAKTSGVSAAASGGVYGVVTAAISPGSFVASIPGGSADVTWYLGRTATITSGPTQWDRATITGASSLTTVAGVVAVTLTFDASPSSIPHFSAAPQAGASFTLA